MKVRGLTFFSSEFFALNHIANHAADLLIQILQQAFLQFLVFENRDGQRLRVNFRA